jgi:hypothetical protein
MYVDHLQISLMDATYDNTTWLYQVLMGAHNDTVDALTDFSYALNAVVGLVKKGTRISSSDTSGSDNMQWEVQDPIYGGSIYLSSADAITLRKNIITQVATITTLQAYRDVAIRSYRNDLQQSDNYAYSASGKTGLEIFVSNFTYKSSYYVEPTDINALLSSVNDALDSIAGLEFAGVVISTFKASTDGIFMGIDDASYNGKKYLSISNATTLRNAIIGAIATVSDINDDNLQVEVIIAQKDNQPST